jgi:hypothetical protein
MGSSAMSLGQYNEARSNQRQWAQVEEYLNGLGDGMSISSAELIQQDRMPLYCLPTEKVLNHDNYISLLDTFIAENAFLPELPIRVNTAEVTDQSLSLPQSAIENHFQETSNVSTKI